MKQPALPHRNSATRCGALCSFPVSLVTRVGADARPHNCSPVCACVEVCSMHSFAWSQGGAGAWLKQYAAPVLSSVQTERLKRVQRAMCSPDTPVHPRVRRHWGGTSSTQVVGTESV